MNVISLNVTVKLLFNSVCLILQKHICKKYHRRTIAVVITVKMPANRLKRI